MLVYVDERFHPQVHSSAYLYFLEDDKYVREWVDKGHGPGNDEVWGIGDVR